MASKAGSMSRVPRAWLRVLWSSTCGLGRRERPEAGVVRRGDTTVAGLAHGVLMVGSHLPQPWCPALLFPTTKPTGLTLWQLLPGGPVSLFAFPCLLWSAPPAPAWLPTLPPAWPAPPLARTSYPGALHPWNILSICMCAGLPCLLGISLSPSSSVPLNGMAHPVPSCSQYGQMGASAPG